MRPAILAFVLTGLGLAACASTREVDTRLPTAFEAPQAAATPAAAPALDRWWAGFGDEQLTALIEQAMVQAPDARSAAARLQEARAARSSTLTAFLPQGNLVGRASRTDNALLEGNVNPTPGLSLAGVQESYTADFDISWEVDLFGRIFAARRAGRGDVAAARFAYEGARASLAANIADSYFQARGLAIQLADARESLRIQSALYDVARIRAERGLGASSDVDRIAGDRAQSEAQVASLEAELAAQRRNLLVLVGRGVEPLAVLPTDASVGRAPPVPRTLPGDLLNRRPDVREAQARLVSALGRKDLQKLAFLPTLTFTPGVGWSRTIQPGFDITTQGWTVGGGLTVPILDIPKLMYDLQAQNARVEQAAISYEKSVQTAYGEAENALVRLDSERRRVAVLTDGATRAERAYEAARIRYARGLDNLEAALSAEQSWRATRSQLTDAQVQSLRRAVQAYLALGGGWPADTAPNNLKS
jgi:outer membrane protein, multidrug efflux system